MGLVNSLIIEMGQIDQYFEHKGFPKNAVLNGNDLHVVCEARVVDEQFYIHCSKEADLASNSMTYLNSVEYEGSIWHVFYEIGLNQR